MNSSLEICPGRRLAPSFHISTSTRTSYLVCWLMGTVRVSDGLDGTDLYHNHPTSHTTKYTNARTHPLGVVDPDGARELHDALQRHVEAVLLVDGHEGVEERLRLFGDVVVGVVVFGCG